MLRIRALCNEPGVTYYAAVERESDGLFYDPSTKVWAAQPSTDPAHLFPLTPIGGMAPWNRYYRATIDTTNWPDGNYCVYVVNPAGMPEGSPACGALHNGDDAPYFPALPTKFTIAAS